MEALVVTGRIRRRNVGNLDRDDGSQLIAAGEAGCATDRILCKLGRRGSELGLLP